VAGRTARALSAAAFLAAGLAGCGQHYWSKPGGTRAQFYRDSQECVRAVSTPTATAVGLGIDEHRYRACLRDLGYVPDKQPTPPPPGWYRGVE
jgi:hypothetical protein